MRESRTHRPLAGKTALVTGSTRGLGRTIAEWLADDGANIIVTGREPDAVESSVQAIRDLGVEAWGISADLSRVGEAHRLADEALSCAPQIDLLVNNAGMSIRGHFWEVTDDDWEYQVNVNFRSPFVLAQRIAKQMIERGIQGRIVNTSTIGARHCHANAAVYDSAKGAVETMTRNMAYELGPFKITVNCVVPGAIPDRPGANPNYDREQRDRYIRHIPFGRAGHADDIAAVVRFFCRPESEFTTGQSLLVDGSHGAYLPER
ncbi:MAG: SDR family oxidoreductase [Thermomicrobiales bacterium]|nr:SDR family oxidoreductase [Thermomicrobiales bacterium]